MKKFLDMLRGSKPSSAQLAKDRLKIVVSHERAEREHGGNFLPQLQKELVDTIATVIAKYVTGIDKEQVKVDLNSDKSVLELNIALPEQVTGGGSTGTTTTKASKTKTTTSKKTATETA